MDDLALFSAALVVSSALLLSTLAGLFFIMLGLYRLVIGNPIARSRSMTAFQQGNVWNTQNGAGTDPKTGLVQPSRSVKITGTKSVGWPVVGGFLIICLSYLVLFPAH